MKSIPCDDCKYDVNTDAANWKCAHCIDYVNYKSVNKFKFLRIIFIVYAVIFCAIIGGLLL